MIRFKVAHKVGVSCALPLLLMHFDAISAGAFGDPLDGSDMRCKTAGQTITKIEAKGLFNHWKGQLIPRDLILCEKLNLQALLAWAKIQIQQRPPIDHKHLISMWKIEQTEKSIYLNPGIGLLQRFTHGAIMRGLTILHKPCW